MLFYRVEGRLHRSGLLVHTEVAPDLDYDRAARHGLSFDLHFSEIQNPVRLNQMPRGGRRAGAKRKPGQLSKRTIEAIKHLGPAGERALGVLVTAMESTGVPSAFAVGTATSRRGRPGPPFQPG
jgi:hypothetical protein